MERHVLRLMVTFSLIALPAPSPGALHSQRLPCTPVGQNHAPYRAEVDSLEPVESTSADDAMERHQQRWKETLPDEIYRSAIEAVCHAEGWRSSRPGSTSSPLVITDQEASDQSDQPGYWEQAVADAGGPDVPSNWGDPSEVDSRPTSAPRARIVSVRVAGQLESADRARDLRILVAEGWRPNASPVR